MKMIKILLIAFLVVACNTLQCLDNKGNEIDWWFLYKLGNDAGDGYTYVYTDQNSDGKWSSGSFQNSNPVSKTVYQLGLYGGSVDKKKVGWTLWNDQTLTAVNGKMIDNYKDPNGYIYAHSKGLIGFDSTSGFFLTHSAPGFPFNHSMTPNNWYFPHGQSIYAQHFYCISISSKAADLEKLATHLLYYHVFVYDFNIPTSMKSSLPVYLEFSTSNFRKTSSHITLKSLGGKSYLGFGKNAATNSDLYEDYIAPGLNTGLSVESWCCGKYPYCCLTDYCKGATIVNASTPQKNSGNKTYSYDSVNIEKLNFGTNLEFSTSDNHAKWAIAYDPNGGKVTPWFCAADMNRVITQRGRGGGAFCTIDQSLWSALKTAVVSVKTICPQ